MFVIVQEQASCERRRGVLRRCRSATDGDFWEKIPELALANYYPGRFWCGTRRQYAVTAARFLVDRPAATPRFCLGKARRVVVAVHEYIYGYIRGGTCSSYV